MLKLMFHKGRSSARLLGVSRHFAGLLAALCLVTNPARAEDTGDEARSINQQVLNLMSTSKLADAAALAKKGLALCDDAGSVKVFCASQFNELLGDIAYKQNQYADALKYHKQALAIRAAGVGHDHLLIARSQFRIARAELALHHNDDAEISFRDAIALFDKLSPRDRERAAALIQLEGLYAASQRFDEAVTVGRRALDASIALDGSSATTTANARRFLGGALLSVGRRQSDQQNYQEAEKSLREGVQLFDPPLPGWENIFATSLTIRGKIYESNGRFADAETYFLRALDYRAKLVQPTDPLLLKILAKSCGALRPNGKSY
jgi:tetratricopeptide (TPR) repeat protein